MVISCYVDTKKIKIFKNEKQGEKREIIAIEEIERKEHLPAHHF